MSESDFHWPTGFDFAMGILSLVATVVGAVRVGFAMFKPKVAMWLTAPASLPVWWPLPLRIT